MLVIAEIGLTHEGSLGQALRLIDAVAWAGASGVKFQCHDGDPCDKFRAGTSFPQDRTRRVYWERTKFYPDEWSQIAKHAKDRRLLFGCSVFSVEALERMQPLVDFVKLGSAQTGDKRLVELAGQSGRHVVLSSGMSDWVELDDAVRLAWRGGCPELTILQCTSMYPTPACRVGLNVAQQIGERYCQPPQLKRHWGLSDHSGTIWPAIAAAHAGAWMVEVHVVQSSWQFGPDTGSSVTVGQLAELVRGVRFVEAMGAVDKDSMAREMEHVRAVFRTA